jgi:O-antigen/teichoic acid export membrane protein
MTFSALPALWKRACQSAMLAGVFGTGIRIGAGLLLLPLVLLKLSSSEVAIWWVFDALGNFANMSDFGFGSTIPRIYSYFMAGADDFDAEGLRPATDGGKPNFAGISRVNATVRNLYLKISLVAIGLLAIGGTLYLIKPAAESGFAHQVWWLWALFIVAIGYNLATYHWVLAVQGLNQMRDLQIVFALGGLSNALCAAALLLCHAGLASMVVATFVKGFIMHGRCRQIYRTIVPKPEHPCQPNPHIVRKLWPNACKFGLIGLSGFCLSSAGVLICGQLLPKEVTASFGLTAKIGTFITSFASLWLGVKWPEIAILRTQGRMKEMAVLFARRLALVFLSFVGMGLIILFAGNTLLAWKGTQTRLLSAPCLAFYLLYLTQGILVLQFGMLAFTENVVPFFKSSIVTGLAVVVSSLILTQLFGLWGLLAAPLVASAIYNWLMVRRGFQSQPLSTRQFALAAIRGHV